LTVSLVVAMADNGVIGREGGLPWRLSTDMKRFKAITMDHPVVMGRKTWESFPKKGPLPGRTNIVITRDKEYRAEGAVVASSLDEALAIAAESPGGDEICVIGGGQIYAAVMDRADRLHVTHIPAAIDGDTRFPPIDPHIWYSVHEEVLPAGDRDDFATRYVIYERRNDAADGNGAAKGLN
jgi:dihydrofolate reductase